MAQGTHPYNGNQHKNSKESNFSVSIENAGNVLIGNNSLLVVNNSQKKSPGSEKKEAIPRKYSLTDSKDEVTVDEKLEIKGRLGRQWRDLGRNLGFEDAELEQIKIQYKDDISELNYQILTKWQQREAGEATKSVLANVFDTMMRGDLADILAMKS